MSTLDGGPAFPVNEKNDDGTHHATRLGVSVRDHFAGLAMQAVPMPQPDLHDVDAVYDRIAQHAYRMADAMLRARFP